MGLFVFFKKIFLGVKLHKLFKHIRKKAMQRTYFYLVSPS